MCALALAPHGARAAAPAGAPVAPVREVGGAPCVGANDVARLLGGALYWRADIRKLVVRAGAHRITLTADAPIVLIDDRTVRLGAAVRSVGGEFQVPVELLPLLPRDSTLARLALEPGGRRVRVAPLEGFVGAPKVAAAGDGARVTIATERPGEARVTARGRERFRVWLPGAWGGGAFDSLPEGGVVRTLRRRPGGDGVTFEIALASGVRGYRMTPDPARGTLALEFASAGAGLEPFAPEGPAGPRPLRVIVLDPGHGGDDPGVTVEGAVEKDLALQLARLLAGELGRRTGARVVLTRDGDRALAQPERAEIANRSRADVVIALHFDGVPRTQARGATAWCAPAAYAAAEGGDPGILPWRDVPLRHAVEGRALADAIAGELETRGLGPARVRERLPVGLLGVNAPGVALECATLTSPEDRARVMSGDGLRVLAAAIAEGLVAYARHD